MAKCILLGGVSCGVYCWIVTNGGGGGGSHSVCWNVTSGEVCTTGESVAYFVGT